MGVLSIRSRGEERKRGTGEVLDGVHFCFLVCLFWVWIWY